MNKRKYAIIGVGGIGGYYGAKLHRTGFDVHFLFKSDYQKVLEKGLTVDSIEGDLSIKNVNAYKDPSQMPKCDVVIVALKTTANDKLVEILPHVCSTDTTIILFQNGLGFEKRIAGICEYSTIMGGLCFICSSKIAPAHIKHVDYGKIDLAQYSPDEQPAGITPQMLQVYQDFISADIETTLNEDLVLARWKKLVWNVPFNGLSVLLNSCTDLLLKNNSTKELVLDLMKEVQAGAASQDRKIEDDLIQNMIINTEKMTPYKPSMKLDYELNRMMEIEAIYDNPIKKAGQAGISLPRMQMLMQCLRYLSP